MTSFVDVALRSSALLLLGLGVTALWRQRAAALRHCVLAACIFAAVLVVPLGRVVPAWTISTIETIRRGPATPDAAVDAVPVAITATGEPGRAGDQGSSRAGETGIRGHDRTVGRIAELVVPTLWAVGSLMAMTLLLIRILRLARLTSRAERIVDGRWQAIAQRVSDGCGWDRQLTLLQTDAPDLIATWGLFRPRILLPQQARTWTEDRIHTVLCHELAHIRRFDWVVQMGAEVVRAVYWFNPLMSIACRQLRRESEHACDDAVLGLGVSAPDYAAHLLELANTCRSGRSLAATMPMARRSTLEGRIAAMLNTGLDHKAPSYRAIVVTIAFLVSAALPVAALRGEQSSPRPLTGSIYDSTGAVLPGVTVTLQDAQEFKWQATTDASGQFDFPPVQPGRYVLEASLMGFRNLRHDFDLKAPRDWDRAITMPVGELTETVTVSASRATKPNQGQGPTPVRVGGNIKAPMKVVNVNPVYPVSMREAGLSGLVPIEAIIGVNGAVLSARVRGAHVHPDFAAAALDAVRQWRFTPTLLNGAPVEVVMNVSVNFQLAE